MHLSVSTNVFNVEDQILNSKWNFFAVPTIPAAHTNAVSYMIGEKAADLVKSTWSS